MGGGCDPKVPLLEQELEPYYLDSIQTVSLEDFLENFWSSHSKYCQNFIKVLIELYNCSHSDSTEKASYKQSWEILAKKGIVGPKGLALALNAYPISFKDRSVAASDWGKYKVRTKANESEPISIKEWTGCDSFYAYKDRVIELRSDLFISERRKRKPKLIICFGITEKENFKTLWGVKNTPETIAFNVDDEFLPNQIDSLSNTQNCWGYWDNETLIMIVPFLTGTHGLNSDKRIQNTCQRIYWTISQKVGDKWLGCSEILFQIPVNKKPKELSNLISKYRRLINSQLACLKEIEVKVNELTTVPNNTNQCFLPASESELDSIKQKLNEFQKQLIHKYMHQFDELQNRLEQLDKKERQRILESPLDSHLNF